MIASAASAPELYRVEVGAADRRGDAAAAAPRLRAARAPTGTARARQRAGRPPGRHSRRAAQNARADVTLEAGDSGTLHVAAPMLALRLAFDSSVHGEATVEVKGGHEARALTGSGAVVLKLRPGTVRYKLRCAGDARGAKPRATGSLTVKRDSGDVPVSRRPAVNVLDADGRRYTVLFQSRLPALTFGLGCCSGGAGAVAARRIARRRPTLPAPTRQPAPRVRDAGGGKLRLVVRRRPTGGRRRRRPSPSASTTRRRTAQFFPRRSGGEPAAPGLVAVDGVTIDGAKVSAGGRSLTVDERGRFQGTVAPLAGDEAVIVRLEHPRTGVHYYVRHPGSRRHARLAHAR